MLLTGFRKGGLYSLDSLHYYTGLFAPSIISLSGAGNFSRDALNYFLAGNSASMRLLVDKTRTGLAGVSQVKDMETMFQLLYTKWMYPQLDTAICKQRKLSCQAKKSDGVFSGRTNVAFERTKLHKYNTF